jgi:hypothetical protein
MAGSYTRTCSPSTGDPCFSSGVGRPNVCDDALLERDFVGVASNSSLISRFLFLERVGEGEGGPSPRSALAKYGCCISSRLRAIPEPYLGQIIVYLANLSERLGMQGSNLFQERHLPASANLLPTISLLNITYL